jgi:hypothetical protein
MKKIILFMLLLISQFLFWNQTFAEKIPVENIFIDIDKNYKYYDELQTLYDKWMIFPDEDSKLNPDKLLNRDEFVWVTMEVTCKKCIIPNTDFSLLKVHYNTKTFYDVNKDNKYFYCIAESDKQSYVKWYGEWYQCIWEEAVDWKRPFCINNQIRLDEALAVVLRNSGLFTIEDNKEILTKIDSWEITKKLSDDVYARKEDWDAYTFYWYLEKSLGFELKEIDKNWEEKTYKLLEKIDNKINPWKTISKEEFLIIAYIVLKSNSCIQEEEWLLAVELNIYNEICIKWEECDNKTFDEKEKVFDLWWNAFWKCEKWINENSYLWKFYNFDTLEEVIKKWKYIDNYEFLGFWKWRISLYVEDNCWDFWEAYSTIFIKNDNLKNNWLSVQIEAEPIIWNVNLNVQYKSLINWNWKNYTYLWHFWDGSTSNLKKPEHTFIEPWTYTTTLIVTDENWNSGEATVVIKVLDFDSCSIDEDLDLVMDCDDILPTVHWDELNDWAPILDNSCNIDCSCQEWYECTKNNPNVCSVEWVCLPKIISLNKCLEKDYSTFIYWNSICNSCPCNYSLDFVSVIRKCDLVFPAITSLDSTQIYSKWNIYQIK